MKVLLGVDGTEGSLRALDQATERAAAAGDELTVAIVGESESEFETDAETEPDIETEAGFGTATLEERVRETLDRVNLDAQVRHLGGDLGSELVELAETGEFDRLVVGGGERSPMGKIDVPHDTQFVLLNAQTSVTLIR